MDSGSYIGKSAVQTDDQVSYECYVKATTEDGRIAFNCKMCNKETKTEASMKSHLKSKHEKQMLKRKEIDSTQAFEEEAKKARFDSTTNEAVSEADFEFGDIASSTQTEENLSEHDSTAMNICEKYLRNSKVQNDDPLALDKAVSDIVDKRLNSIDNDLIDLNSSFPIPVDQDHNYLVNQDTLLEKEANKMEELRNTISSLRLETLEKDRRIQSLMNDLKLKEDASNILVAKVNSLDERNLLLEKKIKGKEAIIQKYSLVLKGMNDEIQDLKSKLSSQENTTTNTKKQEVKSLQLNLKKKDAAVKEQQLSLNDKNNKIATLEAENSRLQMLVEQTQVLSKGISPKAEVEVVSSKVKESKPIKAKKCKFENLGTCIHPETCEYFHPKGICQSYSKLGACSLEVSKDSSCDFRHPKKTCNRFVNTGYCPQGDNCRYRHPLQSNSNNYASIRRHRILSCYNNYNFLGTSPQSSQGPGWHRERNQQQPYQRESWNQNQQQLHTRERWNQHSQQCPTAWSPPVPGRIAPHQCQQQFPEQGQVAQNQGWYGRR